MARSTLTVDDRAAIYAAAWTTAAADGLLGSREKRLLRQIQQELSIPRDRVRRVEWLGYQRKLKLEVPTSPDARQEMFKAVIRVAASDRGLAERERSVALSIGRQLGLSDSCIEDALSGGEPSSVSVPSKADASQIEDGLAAKLVGLLPWRGRRPWYLRPDLLDAITQGWIAATFLAVWVFPDWFSSNTIRGMPMALFVELVSSFLVVWIGGWAAGATSGLPVFLTGLALALVTTAIGVISILMGSFLPIVLFLPSVWSGYVAGRERKSPDLRLFLRVCVLFMDVISCACLPLPALGFKGRPARKGSGEWKDTATGKNVTHRFLAAGVIFYGFRSIFSTMRLLRGDEARNDDEMEPAEKNSVGT